MAVPPSIVLLYGFPAVGKFTLAAMLVERLQATGMPTRLVDNHYVNNPIFGLLDIDGVKPVPDEAWTRILEIRSAMIETIRTLSPPDWSFVFTNHLVDGHDGWVVDELQALADQRNARFLLVRLDCDLAELRRRIGSPDRRARLKWTDPEGLQEHHERVDILRPPDHVECLTIDTTRTSPETNLATIMSRLAELGHSVSG